MKKIISDITKISSKGQLIIPAKIRQELRIKDGNVFSVAAVDGVVVLKKLDSRISKEDLKTLKRVEDAWKDVEEGRFRIKSKEDFIKEMEAW
jgi:AbrB family looped-hinge helix DNA binding protein